jgi:predicted TIM-barrel fold metal-dependent hydrolase
MSIIDVHHHWINEPDYLEHLLREMDRLEIDRAGLMAMGAPFRRLFVTQPEPTGCVDNRDVAAVLRTRADRFFGYGFFHLGRDRPDLIDRFRDQGFAGVKFHIPAWDYDDERCFPAYERAAANGLLCLFHTGVFRLPEPLPEQRVSSARCRPIMLDAVANAFPELIIIVAHLGVCWGEEAATLCRIQPNVYADLSGAAGGWRAGKPIDWFREMLYWPEAHRKLLFGSDVHYSELAVARDEQIDILRRMGWDEAQVRAFLQDNASRLLARTPAG